MALVIAHHRVKDFDAWKPYYMNDAPRRQSHGITDLKLGTPANDPNDVYMVWDAKDPSKVEQMVSDPSLKELMEKAGVISPPELVVVLNER